MRRTLLALALVLVAHSGTAPAAPAAGPRPPAMRTRMFDALTTREISGYLARNDIILIPIGTVEMHGEMPVGAEYVLPLAVATRMAEQVDALVLPHLAYFYSGATAIGHGTLDISPSAGLA